MLGQREVGLVRQEGLLVPQLPPAGLQLALQLELSWLRVVLETFWVCLLCGLNAVVKTIGSARAAQ